MLMIRVNRNYYVNEAFFKIIINSVIHSIKIVKLKTPPVREDIRNQEESSVRHLACDRILFHVATCLVSIDLIF